LDRLADAGLSVEPRRFRALVREAVASLPADLLRRVENVDIVIQRRATARDRKRAGVGAGGLLFGLYQGVPLTQRGHHYNLALPDRISIYQEAIEAICHTEDEVRAEVRKTVLHELGHYFGIDDDRLRDLGMS